jgi:hypothetical protein
VIYQSGEGLRSPMGCLSVVLCAFDSVQARLSDSGPTRSKTDDPIGAILSVFS